MNHRVDERGVGPLGESIAARFLERRGFEIVDRNVRIGRDEVDLIAQRRGDRIIVEVKCTADGTDPVDAVDTGKMQRLVRASQSLEPRVIRIDLVSVMLMHPVAEVRWLKNV